jgi:hypothetical protein
MKMTKEEYAAIYCAVEYAKEQYAKDAGDPYWREKAEVLTRAWARLASEVQLTPAPEAITA